MKILNNYIYIKYYPEYTNKLLVIGVLRKLFKFKFFMYINLNTYFKNVK